MNVHLQSYSFIYFIYVFIYIFHLFIYMFFMFFIIISLKKIGNVKLKVNVEFQAV